MYETATQRLPPPSDCGAVAILQPKRDILHAQHHAHLPQTMANSLEPDAYEGQSAKNIARFIMQPIFALIILFN
jgi:hypothetical protein